MKLPEHIENCILGGIYDAGNPLSDENGIRRDVVETEKKNLVATIEASLNHTRQYAALQLLKLMCREDTMGIPRLGEPEQVEIPETANELCDILWENLDPRYKISLFVRYIDLETGTSETCLVNKHTN